MIQSNHSNLPGDIRALIIDMDGVLWRADEPIGNLPEIFSRLEQHGLQFILATNNSTRTPSQYVEKLQGFKAVVREDQIITSSQAAAQYLHSRFPAGGPVYILGETGLRAALAKNGFHPTNIPAVEVLAGSGNQGQVPLAVVVGMDRDVSYEKLTDATFFIRAGAPFIVTNPDTTFPTPQGLAPGTGAIVAAIEAATQVRPYVLGKPFPGMYEAALQRLGVQPHEVLAVGDRLETDIAGAQALGCRTGLVLSGVTTPAEAQAWQPSPDFIAVDLTALLHLLGV